MLLKMEVKSLLVRIILRFWLLRFYQWKEPKTLNMNVSLRNMKENQNWRNSFLKYKEKLVSFSLKKTT